MTKRVNSVAFGLTTLALAASIGSCSSNENKAAVASSPDSCPVDLSYAGREYHEWKPRDDIAQGDELGTSRYEYCGELAGSVKVSRVPGFAPKVAVQVVDSPRDDRYVFISDAVLRGNETAAEISHLRPHLRDLLLGKGA